MNKRIPIKLLSGAAAAALALSLLPAVTEAASEYTAKGATEFTFSNSGITAEDGSYTGYKISGTDLTIQESGTYLISGSCADGSIKIKKGTTGVTLVLDGLTLTSADTAPISCNKSTEVTIVAASGTENTLTDSEKNNDGTYTDNENAENAVIKCKDGADVTICGSGTLNIVANGKNGIKSGANTDEDGDASLTIRNVELNISAPVNDAINAEQQLDIESGTLTISAGDDAVHSDLALNIGADGTSGPTITITDCYEGLEAATLNIYSGNISITASDDCLNAANSDLTNYNFSMSISGGTIYAYSSTGDGFDSNGDLTISGGTVTVWTANTADNQPLDADGTLTVSGGTVLAAGGSSGMGIRISAAQPYVTFGSSNGKGGGQPGSSRSSSALVSKGGSFTLKDSSGSTVYSGTTVCNTTYIFFSSPKLTSGSSYTLYAGSTSAATASAQTGTSSSGGMSGSPQPGNGGSQPPAAPGASGSQQPPAAPDGSSGQPSGGAPAQSSSFNDMSTNDWFYEAFRYVLQNGLMNGTSVNTFSPYATITRGMLVTILYRLDGEPAVTGSCPFSDVPSGSYCEQAAIWAASNQIVSGYGNGCFGPSNAVTREQLAVILYRYAQYKGYDLSSSAELTGYADQASIGSFARPAMSWANASGLINGNSSGMLLPKGTATRAQTAVILMRFCEEVA